MAATETSMVMYRREFRRALNLGYGISGGHGFIWLCLPFVNSRREANQLEWWGDPAATAAYARDAVHTVCQNTAVTQERYCWQGFRAGSIGCNYIGLRDEATAEIGEGSFATATTTACGHGLMPTRTEVGTGKIEEVEGPSAIYMS